MPDKIEKNDDSDNYIIKYKDYINNKKNIKETYPNDWTDLIRLSQ